ncbi:MAG: MerR family transcriptional regulator [Hyphomicrobiales bacterium]
MVGERTIGELAAEFGLGPSVLRHWEQVGLLEPDRRVSGRRRYGPDATVRIGAILLFKNAGFSLDETRELLAAGGFEARRVLLERKLDELRARIAQAEAASEAVREALHCDAPDVLACERFRAALPGPSRTNG